MWSDNFILQSQLIRDRLSQTSDRFNSFLIRSLSLVKSDTQTAITPRPRIEQIAIEPTPIEGIDNLRGVSKKYKVSGVSRRYARLEIEQEGTTFLIDDTIKCYLIPGTVKEGLLCWEFELEEVVIEQNFYG